MCHQAITCGRNWRIVSLVELAGGNAMEAVEELDPSRSLDLPRRLAKPRHSSTQVAISAWSLCRPMLRPNEKLSILLMTD